ncbi:MAG TPA: CsbD family protein [Lapillicoccus sp.]|nr:CsbD family protein [Lapillicoccus sp.]
MGLTDKAQNQAEIAKGKVKEGVGDATDNERMQAEGEADQASGNMKQAGEKVKDAFRD